jgi:hypothetical protein
MQHEVGTKIAPKINFEFVQNDGGEIVNVEFGPNNNEQQEEVVILDEGNVEYSVIVNFAEGPQKFDDFGEPAGQPLPAGQLKAVCSYSGFRCNFFGADDKKVACESSEEVRSLNKAVGDNFVLEAPAGSRRLTIAVPANGKQPISVEYNQQGDAEYISNFVKSTVSVSGAIPGENMMDYNVYTFIFLIPCAAKMTFDVLLG